MIVPVAVVAIIFLAFGVSCLLFTNWIRKYDTRMTRFVRNEKEYKAMLLISAFIFMLAGIFAGVFSIFGSVQ